MLTVRGQSAETVGKSALANVTAYVILAVSRTRTRLRIATLVQIVCFNRESIETERTRAAQRDLGTLDGNPDKFVKVPDLHRVRRSLAVKTQQHGS